MSMCAWGRPLIRILFQLGRKQLCIPDERHLLAFNPPHSFGLIMSHTDTHTHTVHTSTRVVFWHINKHAYWLAHSFKYVDCAVWDRNIAVHVRVISAAGSIDGFGKVSEQSKRNVLTFRTGRETDNHVFNNPRHPNGAFLHIKKSDLTTSNAFFFLFPRLSYFTLFWLCFSPRLDLFDLLWSHFCFQAPDAFEALIYKYEILRPRLKCWGSLCESRFEATSGNLVLRRYFFFYASRQ